MENSIYQVNKNINKALEFKGLKAQYVWHLAIALVGLMILYSIMYIVGINSYICLVVIIGAGAGAIAYVYRMSNTYGQYGWMKKMAARKIPKVLRNPSRKIFIRQK